MIFNFNFLNMYFSSFFNFLNLSDYTFNDYLNTLGSVLSLFLNKLVETCTILMNSWFIQILVGFGLFVSVIWIAFDILDLSIPFFNLSKDSIDDYLDKKADREHAINKLAEKELIMRQNYEYKLQQSIEKDSINELIMRQNYEYRQQQSIEKDSIKELLLRQNRLQYFDVSTGRIENLTDIELIRNLNARNLRNYGIGTNVRYSLRSNNQKQNLPYWFDIELSKEIASNDEQSEMKELLKGIENND